MLEAYLPPIPDDARPTGERGDIAPRLVATLIDGAPFVLWPLSAFLAFFTPCLGWLLLSATGLGLIFYTLVFLPWCVAKHGATIGRRMQRLRVVPRGRPYDRLDLGPAVLRQFGYLFGLNLFFLAFKGDERLSLSDLIAESEVIKVDR